MKRCSLALLFLLLVTAIAQTQVSGGTETELTSSFSKEAVVIESVHNRQRYESDGTGVKSVVARVRIQSEAGVQAFGTIALGYNTAFETIEIEYVRVTKPDGTKITADTNSVQDLPSEIQRIAPQYTDFREKHINVPGLRPGDVLEYSVITRIHAPLIPGHFFTDHSFEENMITLDEQMEIDVPADRPLSKKFSVQHEPSVRKEDGRIIYSWKSANTKTKDENEAQKPDGEENEDGKTPDIQLSTFQTWGEVAKWYAELLKPRIEPTETIRAKAAALTKGLTGEREKVEAIYNYVATNIRYLGLSFGQGRYQPHAASEVLTNQYGDCKDKHSLLAALLQAAGIQSDAILINSALKLDPDVPNPAQFNHLITSVSVDGSHILADTTTEVAPLGYLIKPLRDKQALRVVASGEGTLITTIKTVPQPNREETTVTGRLTDAGDLEADITHSPSGDSELVWRLLLRRTAESQWRQMLSGIWTLAEIKGEISDITTENLGTLGQPLKIKYHLSKKGYTDLEDPNAQLKLPLPIMNIRPAATPEQRSGPIRAGVEEVVQKLKLEVPRGLVISVPGSTNESKDFGQYRASYKAENNFLHAERIYKITADEIPRARHEEFTHLYEAANLDRAQSTNLFRPPIPGTRSAGLKYRTQPSAKAKGSADTRSASELFNDAREAFRKGEMNRVETLLTRVVAKDPNHPEAWLFLSTVYTMRRSMDSSYAEKSIQAAQKHIEMNPKDPRGYQQLSFSYYAEGRYSESADNLLKQAEVNPDDRSIDERLGHVLLLAKRPKEAIGPLERTVEANPSELLPQVNLAKAYYQVGDKEKADKIVLPLINGELSPTRRASIAEVFTESKDSLDLAEQQVQLALSEAYDALGAAADIKLADEPGLQRAWKLGILWDSAGWVYFQRGDLIRAQRYLEAAWAWSQQSQSGDRLAQVYMKQGRKEDAIRTWAQATSTQTVEHPEIRARFMEAVGSPIRAKQLIAQHRLDLQQVRTLDVANPKKLSGTAEFYLFVGSGSKIEAVGQYSGDKEIAALSEQVKKARLELPVPDEQPIHVLRSGILSCYSLSPSCKFVLNPPPSMMMMDDGF